MVVQIISDQHKKKNMREVKVTFVLPRQKRIKRVWKAGSHSLKKKLIYFAPENALIKIGTIRVQTNEREKYSIQ